MHSKCIETIEEHCCKRIEITLIFGEKEKKNKTQIVYLTIITVFQIQIIILKKVIINKMVQKQFKCMSYARNKSKILR